MSGLYIERKNKDIRMAIEAAGIYYWMVAQKMKVSSSQFSIMLREEFSDQQKKQVLQIVDEISKEIERQNPFFKRGGRLIR